MSQLRKIEESVRSDAAPWGDDLLNRQTVAKYSTDVVGSITQPFSIAVYSPYGTGKTFFLERWRTDLQNAGNLTIKFNAWANDFSNDPFLAFISEFNKEIRAEFERNEIPYKGKDLVQGAKKLAVSEFFPLVLRALLRKATDNATADELLSLLGGKAEDVTQTIGRAVEASLEQQDTMASTIAEFKCTMQKFVQRCSNKTNTERIIVLVDEMDRCRPDFAINLIEAVKHFFNVEGVVFVFFLAETQMHSCVRSVFGPLVDVDGYLRRFFDWRVRLPRVDNLVHAKSAARKFGLDNLEKLSRGDVNGDLNHMCMCVSIFSDTLELSLREQEQIFTEINLAVRSLSDNQAALSTTLASFAALRQRYAKDLELAISNKKDRKRLLLVLDDHFEAAESEHWLNFFGGWTFFRPTFESWFLGRREADEMMADIVRAVGSREDANELLWGSYEGDVESEVLAMSLVVRARREAAVNLRSAELSVAKIVWGRLEFASSLS